MKWLVFAELLRPVVDWAGSPGRSTQLRLLLLLCAGWWLLAPLSALLAEVLSVHLSRTDSVIVASFIGPLLCLGVILLGLWPRKSRLVLAGLAIVAIILLSFGGRV